MKTKSHTKKGAGIRAREALVWLRIENGSGGMIELPKALPIIRF